MDTILVEDTRFPLEIGVYIDIFVNDKLSNNYKEAKRIVREISILKKILIAKTLSNRNDRSILKKVLLRVGRLITIGINPKTILRKIESLALEHKDDLESQYCGSVTSLYYGSKEIMLSAWWLEGDNSFEFERVQFCAPVGYAFILQQLYGDFMQLPPEEDRVSHHSYCAFGKN